MSEASERSIVSITALVMVYDNSEKAWQVAGKSEGNSKVQIYNHSVNNTFRVVARKLHDHEVVINVAILRSTKYNRATETFHQWRDKQTVYGLNFLNIEDANLFGQTMENVLQTLNTVYEKLPTASTPYVQPKHIEYNGILNNNTDEQRNDYNINNRAIPSLISSKIPNSITPQTPTSNVLTENIDRNNQQPVVIVPPSERHAFQIAELTGQQIAAVTSVGAPPPPPPPPPPAPMPMLTKGNTSSCNNTDVQDGSLSGLAAAIANAKLKKSAQVKDNESIELEANKLGQAAVPFSVGSTAPVGTDMMSEMAARLLKRKVKVENDTAVTPTLPLPTTLNRPKPQSFDTLKRNAAKEPSTPNLATNLNLASAQSNKNDISNLNISEKIKLEIFNHITSEVNRIKEDILAAIRNDTKV